MSAHAILAPSDAARWVECPASVGLQALYPDLPSDDAADGDAAHWVAAAGCRSLLSGPEGFTLDGLIGSADPAGTRITEDIVDGARAMVEHVAGLRVKTGVLTPEAYRVEQRVDIGTVHAHNWGTPDFSLWAANLGTLYVSDFKYGWKIVEARENWQLIDYAVGLLDALGVGLSEHVRVVLTIVQPRPHHRDGPVRSWSVQASDLRPYVNQLQASAAEALGRNARTVTGEHCYKCKALHACEAAHRAAYDAFDYVSGATPMHLTGGALGAELARLRSAARAIGDRLDGIESEAEARIRNGERVDGWALESKPGRLAWSQGAAGVLSLGDMLGVNLRRPPEPVTPTQAKDRKLIDPDTLKSVTTRPDGAAKLVPAESTAAYAAFNGDK